MRFGSIRTIGLASMLIVGAGTMIWLSKRQPFPRTEELRDIGRFETDSSGVSVSQVTQAIQPHARRHPAKQFAFGLVIVSGADSPHHLPIAQSDNHHHIFYV
jgi:hypothetical protein